MLEDKSIGISSMVNSCDICHKEFQSKTHLARHKNRKKQCKPQLATIDKINLEIFNEFKKLCDRTDFSLELCERLQAYLNDKEAAVNEANLISKLEHKCSDCGMEFAHRQSLHKHSKLNRCSIKLETTSQKLVISNND